MVIFQANVKNAAEEEVVRVVRKIAEGNPGDSNLGLPTFVQLITNPAMVNHIHVLEPAVLS